MTVGAKDGMAAELILQVEKRKDRSCGMAREDSRDRQRERWRDVGGKSSALVMVAWISGGFSCMRCCGWDCDESYAQAKRSNNAAEDV